MLRNFILLIMITIGGASYGQTILNMDLLSNIEFGESGNDVWGFVDATGTEYAVMGTRNATRIYSLEDPTNPVERYVVTGAGSVWRDIKYYNNHLYVTTDQGSEGLTIIDCTMAPDSFTHSYWKPEIVAPSGTGTLQRAHNIYIDTDTGFAYLAGHNVGNRGIMICDLKVDPKEPVITAVIDQFYSHDAYVHDGRLYSSELGAGLAIYNITDPSNPIEITRQETSTDFCHNAWATLDNQYVFTTDERSSAYMDAYDVSEDGSALFLDKYRPLESINNPVIPHNTHILGDFAITSWYTDGVVITDISNPSNIIKVGQYDTYTNEASLNPNGAWFEGAWGAYPYLPSGLVLVSDINTGLYVFGTQYKSASFLEGKVTSKVPFELGKAISGAKVEILGTQLAYDKTLSTGNYKTGNASEGMFRVAFSHPNYISDTLDVELVSGQITILDAQLTSSYLISTVVDDLTNAPIEGAKVVVLNDETGTSDEYVTNQDGNINAVVKAGSKYQTLVASWGYLHEAGAEFTAMEGENASDFRLTKGYQDDFFADLNWEVTTMAETGNWDRNPPVGTINQGEQSNPGQDVQTDLGNSCWTTGNSGTSAAEDDIDGGVTTLQSPVMDMSSWLGANLKYSYWFYNSGGSGTPNDSLIVYLTNGSDIITLDKYTISGSNWKEAEFKLTPQDISFTSDMSLIVTAGDYPQGHLVEGAFDAFSAQPFTPSNTNNPLTQIVTLQPNPSRDLITISLDVSIKGNVEIINTLGQTVSKEIINGDYLQLNVQSIPNGNYYLKVTSEGRSSVIPFVKI